MQKKALIFVKATAEQTDDAFTLFEVTCQPNYTTSLHIYYAEDVEIYMLEGALTLASCIARLELSIWPGKKLAV